MNKMNGVRICLDKRRRRTKSSSYYFRLIRAICESFQKDSHCYLHCQPYPYLLKLAGYGYFRVSLEKEPYIIQSCRFHLCSSHIRQCLTVFLKLSSLFISYVRSSSLLHMLIRVIRKYNWQFVDLAPYSHIFILLLSRKNQAQMKSL